jgi:exonuclease SbcC
MIKSIIMTNIKRQNREQPLTGRDIIVGPNGSGKTTCMQTQGIAMFGFVPGAGKLPSDTYKLCSGESMIAGLKLDDFVFSRTFEKTVKENKKTGATEVKISQDINLSPGKGETNLTQKEARVMAEVGNFSVMLDFGEFINMSDTKRREFIYNLSPVKVDNWDINKIGDYLEKNMLSDELKINNPDKYALTVGAINDVLNSYPKGFDVQAGLTSMIDFTKKKLSYWKEQHDQADGAAKKLAELKNNLSETDRNIANNKTELEDVQKKLTDITAQIAKDQEKIKANNLRQTNIDELLKAIENIETSKNPYILSDLKAALKTYKDKLLGDIKDFKKIREDLQKQSEEFNRLANESQEQLNEINSDPVVKKAIGDLAVYKSALKVVSEMKADDPRCIIHQAIGCTKDFTGYVKMAEGKIIDLESLIKINDDLKKELETKITNFIKDREKAKDGINRSFVEERQETVRIQKIKDDITLLENNIKTAENFDADKADRVKEKQFALDKLQATPVEAVADIIAATTLQTSYTNRISTLKGIITEQERAKTTISNMQASMIDNKVSSYNADAFKFISDLLGAKGIQGEIVKSILEPIRSDIQDKFYQLGIERNFYFSMESDTGKEVFQFGWSETIEDRFEGAKQLYHNFDALSTGEQLLLMSALMITIIERSNPKLKILAIDNLNDLDEKNFRKVMHGLSVIGGNMDNIILAGVVGQYLKETPESDKLVDQYKGFKVWDLSPISDDNKAV